MLPCHNCIHKENIPGDAHVACRFRWGKYITDNLLPFLKGEIKIPSNQHGVKVAKWFCFPLNYDPCWGQDECAGFSNSKELTEKDCEYRCIGSNLDTYLHAYVELNAVMEFLKEKFKE